MTYVVHSLKTPSYRVKMAGFDFDGTLVFPKGGRQFPREVDDWEFFNSEVPTTIRKYYEEGFMIVIFTNQSKDWKHDQIKIVSELLEIPLFIVIATDKEMYKPNINLFNKFIGDNTINKDESFFVGDALGRKIDFASSDRLFAENIGITVYPPENIFKLKEINFEIPTISLSNEPEVIILMGYPGSGKSTIAKQICKENPNYNYIERDIYKTPAKMKKKALEYIIDKKSIIFDATNSSIKSRKEFILFAQNTRYTRSDQNYPIKCVHVTLSRDLSYKRNLLREDKKKVPQIAYAVYNKYFEEPKESEGFTLINV